MATSAEEPQPCDMESPIRSLGLPDLPGEGPAGGHDVGPAGDGRVGQGVHHGVGHARGGQRTEELEAVVRGRGRCRGSAT